MSERPFLLSRVLLLTIVMLSLAALSPQATAAQGNSQNAKLCQKGGWQSLVREDGTPFTNQGDCVSYGAQGGTIYPAAAVPCLAGGWATHARAESPTVAFASEDECIGYVMNGGEIVDLQTVVPDKVLTLNFLQTDNPNPFCELTADLANFPVNTRLTVEFWVYEVARDRTFLQETVTVTMNDVGGATAYGGYLLLVGYFPYDVQARASDGTESDWTRLNC